MSRPLQITDHALVRYLERVHGMDLDAVRNEMLADLGPCIIDPEFAAIRHGLIYQVRGGRVVTCYRAGEPDGAGDD